MENSTSPLYPRSHHGYGNLWPISVTSILSRTVEKLMVKNHLTTLLDCSQFHDQYAYKPTGSSTCALADFTYRIHTLLESNQYVRCVLIYFSIAFDMIVHAILARKLFRLQVPVFIIFIGSCRFSQIARRLPNLVSVCLHCCLLIGQLYRVPA